MSNILNRNEATNIPGKISSFENSRLRAFFRDSELK